MSIRIDPTQFHQKGETDLLSVLTSSTRPHLVDKNGNSIDLPEPLFNLLVQVLQEMKKGNSIVMMPENEQFTTQAAANFLGVSRQYLVTLLEEGKIPFHKVGTHRRVHFKDLLEYQKQRDQKRTKALDEFYTGLDKSGLYDPTNQ